MKIIRNGVTFEIDDNDNYNAKLYLTDEDGNIYKYYSQGESKALPVLRQFMEGLPDDNNS